MLDAVPQEKYSFQQLSNLLRSLGSFYYWPNEGNLGDLLIAESTRQFFARENISWKPYNPDTPPQENSYNLVYGGGGRFTSHWGGLEKHTAHLTAPQVKRCVILPHSFHQVDSFLQCLDNRHTVYCRGKHSLSYVRENTSPHVTVEAADDMALALQLASLPDTGIDIPGYEPEQTHLAAIIQKGIGKRMKCKVWLSTVRHNIEGKSQKVAFLLRTDAERHTSISSFMSFDISLVWSSSCAGNRHTPHLIRLFAEALQYPDIIVTDRLHVGILSLICGKQVYLLDNDYGKLREVYQQSIHGKYPATMITERELPPALWKAFQQLDCGWKSQLFRAAKFLLKRA